MLKMQKQEGNHDCGVFAIAVATSLSHSTDPIHFQQDPIRSHLHRYFEIMLVPMQTLIIDYTRTI